MSENLILLIDDENNILFGLSAMLRRSDYEVLTARNGKEALPLIEKHLPDLIVSDVMMAPINGFELQKILSQDPRTASIPFIFLTARTAQGDKIFGLNAGADDYITKPFDRRELLARVQAVLRRSRANSQKNPE